MIEFSGKWRKWKEYLASSYHYLLDFHSQPQSLSHVGVSAEPSICSHKLQCPGGPGMAEVLLQKPCNSNRAFSLLTFLVWCL